MIPVIVINLKRNTERRARVSERLNALGIAFEVCDGIDGSTLSKEERDKIAPPERWLRSIEKRHPVAGEVGCALSHIDAMRANAEHEFFCVLEDDAVPS